MAFSLFSYGTLQEGAWNHSMIEGAYKSKAQAKLQGYVSWVYGDKQRGYPIATFRHQGQGVAGTIYYDVDYDALLPVVMMEEGAGYKTVKVGELICFDYGSKTLEYPEIPNGDWLAWHKSQLQTS